MVSRQTDQKGHPLIKAGMDYAIAAGAQVVILGDTSDTKVEGLGTRVSRDLRVWGVALGGGG